MRTNEVDGSRRAFIGLTRGVLKKADDTKKMQLVDTDQRTDETQTEVEHFLPYGFTFVPHEGAEAITAYLGGNAAHPVVLLVPDRRHRPNDLATGEVAIHDDQGQMVHIKRDGIRLVSPTKVIVEAPAVHLGGEGGPQVARVGDKTSDNALITEGSSKVFAVD